MKPYPTYKDSGVEWIGDIPVHWKARKLKYEAYVEMGQSPSSEDYTLENNGFPFLQGNADFTELYPTPRIWCDTANKMAKDDDVLLSVRAPIGAVNIADQKYGIGRGLCAIHSVSACQKYLYYTALSLHDELNSIGTGSTYTAISVDDLRNVFVPQPPTPDQKQIVTFLDHKTQKIDELIEKTEQKIELLKEKRTSLINHCVTKGLNGLDGNACVEPVEIKDSGVLARRNDGTGVEWIGEIPNNWGVSRLKFLSFIKYGLGQPPRELEDGLPIIRATNISEGNISPHDLLYADPNDIPYDRDPILKENDIIVVRSGAYTGDSAIIPKEYEGAVAGYDMVVRAHKAEPKYIAYSLLSYSVLHNQIDLCRIRAAQPHLNAEELGNTLIFLPPNPEQKQIVEYLDVQTQKIDSTIKKESQRIELLKEYRQSLISEVVTGKIDVRDWKN